MTDMTDIEAMAALLRDSSHLVGGANGDEDPSLVEPSPFHTAASASRIVNGWEFVNATDKASSAIWGRDGEVLQAHGEGLMIVAPEGCGKTTLGQQLMLARAGILPADLLGLPVEPAQGLQLYIAADRPKQAAKSMRRMITDADEAMLREGIIVHRGPLPFDATIDQKSLREFVVAHQATDVYIDSLKDIALELSTDKIGGAVNLAFQELIAAGIELVVLHHQRKPQPGASAPKKIADVYGSRWLTAGMGSVICLWGEPGDPIVAFSHIKQPEEPVGPFDVLHDHVRGRTTVHDHTDLEQLIAATLRGGLTCKDAARLLFKKDEPRSNDIEKARRKLEALVGRNRAWRKDDPDGLARYFSKDAG